MIQFNVVAQWFSHDQQWLMNGHFQRGPWNVLFFCHGYIVFKNCNGHFWKCMLTSIRNVKFYEKMRWNTMFITPVWPKNKSLNGQLIMIFWHNWSRRQMSQSKLPLMKTDAIFTMFRNSKISDFLLKYQHESSLERFYGYFDSKGCFPLKSYRLPQQVCQSNYHADCRNLTVNSLQFIFP